MWTATSTGRRRTNRDGPRPVILMYHRVAAPRVDPWGLAVHPDRFEQHLAVLRRTRRVLPMSELAATLERGALPEDAVAATFDDGYADNLHEAEPRLQAAGVPATLFLMTGTVGQRAEYWWDALARVILLHRGRANHAITVGGDRISVCLPDNDAPSRWRPWRGSGRRRRENVYLALWRRLREGSAEERERVLRQLSELLDPPPADSADFPMSADEVEALIRGGIFEIGSHTVTHAVLPPLQGVERERELRDSRLACERLAKRRIEGFAYPHGEHDPASRAAVQDCGFSWACSTRGRPLTHPAVDRFALPRLTVRDWDAPAFEQALQAAGS